MSGNMCRKAFDGVTKASWLSRTRGLAGSNDSVRDTVEAGKALAGVASITCGVLGGLIYANRSVNPKGLPKRDDSDIIMTVF